MLIDDIIDSKPEPSRNAKLVLIYSEGEKTEKAYVKFFKQRSSQIKLEVETVPEAGVDDSDGNNSPTGLLALAKKHLIKSDDNNSLKYDLDEDDEVWFLIDTDDWKEKIDLLYKGANENGWQVAHSNPCFEVWLYYHHHEEFPSFEDYERSTVWKEKLNSLISGGFNSKKHPSLIESAINNSENTLIEEENKPNPGCTTVFRLGKILFEMTKNKLN